MKIEVGKFYKTRDGRKVGPAFIDSGIASFGHSKNVTGSVFSKTGRSSYVNDPQFYTCHDIVSEWHEGPVQTETRKEIVPGDYKGVIIEEANASVVRLKISHVMFTACDLREAANLFNTVAEALEENAKEQNDD